MSGSGQQDSKKDDSSFVAVKIVPDPGFELTFDGLTATEELGRPFLITLDLSSGKVKGNTASMLGSAVTITLTSATGDKEYFNGILTRIGYAGLADGVYRYHVELRPWIWLLTRVQDCKIFQKKSAWDIINAVFKDKGFSSLSDQRKNQAGETVLDYCVQYRETSFDFVTRLMEQFGIYYYFEHSDGEHKLVLADDPNSHTTIGKIPFYVGQTEQRSVEDHVWEFAADLHLQPGATSFRDYNFTTPAADLTAKALKSGNHPYDDYEIYDYPGSYDTVDNGQKLADVRMQGFTSRVQLFHGHTNARGIRAGAKFTLDKFSDADLNQEYTVTRAVTSLTIAEGASDKRGNLVDSHRVEFMAMAGTVPFRLEQRTAKPMIRGPQTAKVVGESGEEITTDQYGRIKVQFYWDRVGTNDENSSCWIRVAQSWGGAGWGAMFIPRIGMEVVVEFLEGNPDRPLVTGIVYNATQTVPYPLPDKKVVTTFKTNSSKGGGGSNELRFDDTKSNEEVFFQAQYNYNKVVLNNETVKIKKDTTTEVQEGNRKVTVTQGNDDHTVSQGNQSTTVSAGNQSVTVSAGNQKTDISAGGAKTTTGQAFEVTAGTSIKLTATASIELTCGGTSLKLDPSGVTISAPMVKASATGMMDLSASGVMSIGGSLVKIN
jgi:type VI secretion system secreted protein VgrG